MSGESDTPVQCNTPDAIEAPDVTENETFGVGDCVGVSIGMNELDRRTQRVEE